MTFPGFSRPGGLSGLFPLALITYRNDDVRIISVRRSRQEHKRANVDFPSWMIESQDREASRLGVKRPSVFRVWLAGRLAQTASGK